VHTGERVAAAQRERHLLAWPPSEQCDIDIVGGVDRLAIDGDQAIAAPYPRLLCCAALGEAIDGDPAVVGCRAPL